MGSLFCGRSIFFGLIREERKSHFQRARVNLPHQICCRDEEELPPIAQIQNWTFYFFLTKQISVRGGGYCFKM